MNTLKKAGLAGILSITALTGAVSAAEKDDAISIFSIPDAAENVTTQSNITESYSFDVFKKLLKSDITPEQLQTAQAFYEEAAVKKEMAQEKWEQLYALNIFKEDTQNSVSLQAQDLTSKINIDLDEETIHALKERITEIPSNLHAAADQASKLDMILDDETIHALKEKADHFTVSFGNDSTATIHSVSAFDRFKDTLKEDISLDELNEAEALFNEATALEQEAKALRTSLQQMDIYNVNISSNGNTATLSSKK
ncbi:hypothetical protein [Longirhabdus pacifica]|uniref:hypothetical protein n=1 Tax=Longirhabdus pacifica TaxID=2305227 RepID=UPI001008E4FA|nr:hypothetical protein [Longirhabdus pacifica]